jgi:hypothetical protein
MQTLKRTKTSAAVSVKYVLTLLTVGLISTVAHAEPAAAPKSPVVNSVVNPDAEEDPNDPILPVYEKADEVMDRIIVTGDRWVNPSNTGFRNFLDRSPNGYGVTEVRLSEMAREEKQRICGNIVKLISFFQCNSSAKGPPTDASSLPFDSGSYSSYIAWQDIALQFARDVYDAKYPGPNGNFDAATNAYRGSLERCNQMLLCIRDVQRFFGVSSVSLPDIPGITIGPVSITGNVNDIVNASLGIMRGGINSSDAGQVVSKFTNALVCGLVTQQENRFHCNKGT